MKGQVTDTTVANFVQKAFQIINNNEHSKFIQWLGNGKQFAIRDIDQFQEIILPKYFRHRNINSFIRQLNMYGFHKSRKQPTKNIFSHPYFQKDRQDLLVNVKRKLKNDQNQTPKKVSQIEKPQVKIVIEQKQTAQKEQNGLVSCTSLHFKSSLCLEKQNQSPLIGMISKSLIMDMNSEVCLRLRENVYLEQDSLMVENEEDHDDDLLSIVDEIENQRNRFNNRTRGISIVKTSNFLQDFEF